VQVERRATLTGAPIIDYLKRGYKDKSLLPDILFDPQTYLERNKINVTGPELTHYCLFGDRSGFYTHPAFCAKVYNEQRGHEPSEISKSTALEHFLSSEPGEVYVSHPHAGRPLSPELLQFVRRVYSQDEEFDPDFYQGFYLDLKGLEKSAARRHYERTGRLEGRAASPRDLMQKFGLAVRDLPLGFFPDEYRELNPDLIVAGLPSDFLPLFGHYIQWGRNENRTIGRWQFYLDSLDLAFPTATAPISLSTDAERIDVGVLIHLFYTELWPELAGFASNFGAVSRDIFVNVVDIAWTPQFHQQLRKLCPSAFVQLSNDDGRDIGGFVRLLDNVDIKKYEFFAWIHSKKSPHIAAEKADYWRRCLLQAFAGSSQIVADCIQAFRDDPSVGLIGAKEWRSTEIGRNEVQFNRMLDLFEIDERHRDVEYLSGTMFLIRSDIVQRIYDVLKSLEFEYGADKDLAFHMDGQVAHAVERVIGNVVRQMGCRMLWR
jgi:hypothetical protein